jgi:hypothetical protein
LVEAPVGKIVRFNREEYDPDVLVARLEALRTVDQATGKVAFKGDLFFDDVVTVLRRAITIEGYVPERDLMAILAGALSRAVRGRATGNGIPAW